MLRTWRSHLQKSKVCKVKTTHALLRFVYEMSEQQFNFLLFVSRQMRSRLYPKYTLPTELKEIAMRVSHCQTRYQFIDIVEDQSEELIHFINFVHNIALNSKDVSSWPVTQNESLTFASPEQGDDSMETDEPEEPEESQPSPPRRLSERPPTPKTPDIRSALPTVAALHSFVI